MLMGLRPALSTGKADKDCAVADFLMNIISKAIE
jgi:hypothetical protein